MAEGNTNYPTALDTNTEQPELVGNPQMDSAGVFHDLTTTAASKAIKALQVKVGITGSADTASLDYKMGRVVPNTLWAGNTGISSERAFTTANDMKAVPFWLAGYMTATKVAYSVGTSSGSVSLAIYNSVGTRLSTSGTQAVGGTGYQSLTVSTIALTPGKYFVAMSVDNITLTLHGSERNIEPGFTSVAASHPCPSTFTPAATPSVGKPSPALIVLP